MSLTRRATQLLVGLWLFGASVALLVRADLGLDPWNVLHQGISGRTGQSIGLVVIAVSVVVLVLWVPLRQRPGVGTLANVVLVGLSLDLTLVILAAPTDLRWRVAYLVVGIVGNAVATALYIGAGLGPGPRDGLMTGLAARGVSIRVARTCIEVTVLVAGWLLGGTVGVGTVAFAMSIGPLVHVLIPRLAVPAAGGDLRHEAARSRR